MQSKAEEFILDVRRATRMEAKPTVTTDSQLIDPDSVARVLQRAMIWLTPMIVEAYNPEAFAAWPKDRKTELHAAVEDFRAVASKVPPAEPATPLQAREGVQAFARLKEAVRNVALSEWLDSGNGLINDVEAWAKEFGWVTRRQPKTMNELLLGKYALDQLYMHAAGNLYILDPVARFIPGGLGAFDLSIQPSFNVTSIYRHEDGTWYINLGVGQGVRGAQKKQLSKHSLKEAVMELWSLL